MTDYLFDGPSAENRSDPQVAALEQLFASMAHDAPLRHPLPPREAAVPDRRRARSTASVLMWVAAAAMVLVATMLWRLEPMSPPEIALHQPPRTMAEPSTDQQSPADPLRSARRTGSAAPSRSTPVDSGRMVVSDAYGCRAEPVHGCRIVATDIDPGWIVTDSPAREGADERAACEHSSTIEPDGSLRLEVATGAVVVESAGEVAWVPAGFHVSTGPGQPPGIPVWASAGEARRELISRVERGELSARSELLSQLTRDDLATLWRLLTFDGGAFRRSATERLATLFIDDSSVLEAAREGREQPPYPQAD